MLAKARELAANEALSPRQRAAFSLELVLTLAEEGATLLEVSRAITLHVVHKRSCCSSSVSASCFVWSIDCSLLACLIPAHCHS